MFDLEGTDTYPTLAGPKLSIVRWMALFAGGIAATVLLAYALDLTLLKRVLPGAARLPALGL